ncbi:MAG: SPASM domain-containing protein [Candidatus Omnitrophica bacterium]|nr:SPASM domain-containing protein [Candidatus Omnitrophota bacterium]
MEIKPSKIRLDASTVCQLKCPTCMTTKGLIPQNLGSKMLKFDDFKKLVDANPWIRSIELSNWGEIFLNNDLLKIAAYAYEKNIFLTAVNGVNLNTAREDMLEGVVKYRFGDITCSIDGATQEVYAIYRKGGDLNAVLDNVRKINEFKTRYKSPLPRLRWQFILFDHNEHEILQARKMARELDMEFYIKFAWNETPSLKQRNLVRLLSGVDAAGRQEYQEKHGKFYLVESMCSQMWLQPQINADGRVLGCCVNYWADYGNAFKEDLTAILNSDKMNYARDMLVGKKEAREDIPCTQCHWYREMKKNKTWLSSKKKINEAAGQP